MRRLLSNEHGVTAIEFALVAPAFFLFLLGMFELGLKTLLQAQLDHVMYQTTVNLSTRNDTFLSKNDFKQNVVCDGFNTALLSCDKIEFGVEALSSTTSFAGRFNESFVNRWNTGCGGSNLIVEFVYPSPDILLPFGVIDMVTFNEQNHMRSRGITRREPILRGSGTLEGGVPC